jgi:hypothetical protein
VYTSSKLQSSNFRTFSDLKNGKVQISKLFPNISELFIRNSELYSESPATGSLIYCCYVSIIIVICICPTCYNNGQKERLCLIIDKCRRQKLCKRAQKISAAAIFGDLSHECLHQRVVRNTIFRKAPLSVVSLDVDATGRCFCRSFYELD